MRASGWADERRARRRRAVLEFAANVAGAAVALALAFSWGIG